MKNRSPLFYFGIGVVLLIITLLIGDSISRTWKNVAIYMACGMLGVLVTILLNKKLKKGVFAENSNN